MTLQMISTGDQSTGTVCAFPVSRIDIDALWGYLWAMWRKPGCYLVARGRDWTSDRAAAAGEGLWLWRRRAASAGRGVVVPGVVLVHGPGKRGPLEI